MLKQTVLLLERLNQTYCELSATNERLQHELDAIKSIPTLSQKDMQEKADIQYGVQMLQTDIKIALRRFNDKIETLYDAPVKS